MKMASVMPLSHPTFTDRAKGWLGVGISAVLSALLAAGLAYIFTVRANDRTSLQQQYLISLQQFEQTGGAMDVGVTNLADAVRERRNVPEAKRNALRAIAEHAGSVAALNPIVGRANMEAYMAGVSTLTDRVEDTTDLRSAMRASQARFDIMHNRTVIREEARNNIYR